MGYGFASHNDFQTTEGTARSFCSRMRIPVSVIRNDPCYVSVETNEGYHGLGG